MTESDWSYSDPPGDLSEWDTLARLTVDEKKTIATEAIVEFPHTSHQMIHEWLEKHEAGERVNLHMSIVEKTGVLVDACAEMVESGENKEALDEFIYGYVYEANLASLLDTDPDDIAAREPLGIWEGVYDDK